MPTRRYLLCSLPAAALLPRVIGAANSYAKQSTNGDGPAHIAISPNGRAEFATNYGSGSLKSYTLERSGQLYAPASHFQYKPVDEQTEHQQPHAHEATTSHDGRWLLANDLGSDRIYIYQINPATGSLTPGTTTYWQGRFKSGPRHLVFHPSGHWVYNANELDSTVDHLRWDNQEGTLTTQGTFVSTLPPAFPTGQRTVSEIITSPDGKFLYVGNRGNETMAKFDIHLSFRRTHSFAARSSWWKGRTAHHFGPKWPIPSRRLSRLRRHRRASSRCHYWTPLRSFAYLPDR